MIKKSEKMKDSIKTLHELTTEPQEISRLQIKEYQSLTLSHQKLSSAQVL